MKVLILTLSFVLIVLSKEVQKENYHGIIFLSNYELTTLSDSTVRIELDSSDIDKAELLLSDFLQLKNESVYTKLQNYKRQYFGIINTEGHKIVYINFITLWIQEDDSWKRDYTVVKDGGDNFFRIKVNIDTGECFDFYVNGGA